MKRPITLQLCGTLLLMSCALQVGAQTPAAPDTAALEAEIKLKELQYKLRQAEQNLKDAEIKALEQTQKEEAARRLIARQNDAEKLLDQQAANALSASDIGKDLQLVTALKGAFGDVPKIGKEGAVTISDGGTTQLLATRSGSAWAAMQIAKQVCSDLKAAGVTGAYIAPVGFDEKVVRTKLFFSEVESIKRYADNVKEELNGVQLASAAGIVAGLNVARYLLGGAQELSKALRPDYGYGIAANTSRANLIEKSIAAGCPEQLVNTELETSLRLGVGTSSLSEALTALITFADQYDGKSAVLTSQIAEAREKLLAEKAKPKEDRSVPAIEQSESTLKGLQSMARQLQIVEPAAKRVKAFLESLKTREAQVLEALVWTNFESKWQNHPRLQLTISAQDVQITKTSAWTEQKILAAAHVEVLFYVVDKDGKVLVSGARMQSASSPVLDLTKAGTSTFVGCAVSQRTPNCP
nr:hypothetical protein [uncultured Rhodoferax sp.]